MNKQLQKLIDLSNKTGDRLVVFDPQNEQSAYVIMGVDDYESLAVGRSEVRGLTEDELLDKINRDIAIWKSDQVEEEIAKLIVDSAYTVHKNLGPGLLEKVYEVCFCHELSKRGLKCERQIDVPIVYDGLKFDEGFRLDVLVEDSIICELKAIEIINPVWISQLLSHLKLTKNRLGFVINFNVPLIKDGIKRLII